MSLVLSNKGKGMQSSSEQPLVGEERYVTTRITAAKETRLAFEFRKKKFRSQRDATATSFPCNDIT